MTRILAWFDDWMVWLLVIGVCQMILAMIFFGGSIALMFMDGWEAADTRFGEAFDAYVLGFLALGWRKAERGSVF